MRALSGGSRIVEAANRGGSQNPVDSSQWIPPQIFATMLRIATKMASFIFESCGFSEINSASDISDHAAHNRKYGVIYLRILWILRNGFRLRSLRLCCA
jgi:hypothetical protein